MRILLLLFLIVPVLEMWLLIEVGGLIGALPTIGLVVLTAVIGVALLKRQGLETLWRGQQKLESGQLPAGEVAEGLILAVAGALLLTPGFCTDAFGFACLIPPLRRRFISSVARHMNLVVGQQSMHAHFRAESMRRSGSHSSNGQTTNGETIDGEFHEEQDKSRLRPPD